MNKKLNETNPYLRYLIKKKMKKQLKKVVKSSSRLEKRLYKQKPKIRWSCSDYSYHEHRFRITAILCGFGQKCLVYITSKFKKR